MKLKFKLTKVRPMISAPLYIFIVDLNNCKEIVKDIQNHHYHDDEDVNNDLRNHEDIESILGKRRAPLQAPE